MCQLPELKILLREIKKITDAITFPKSESVFPEELLDAGESFIQHVQRGAIA